MGTYASFEAPPKRPRSARRSRVAALVSLFVAIGSGSAAYWLIARAISRHRPAPISVPMRKVAVAKSELPLATTLQTEMITLVDWPVAAEPSGAYSEAQPLVGRVVRTALVAGEPLVESRLAAPGGGQGLAAVIPPTLRAMTVKVNEASGVAGFVHPGDFVDVIATMAPRHDIVEVRSRIVLQGIRVVAVGEEMVAENAKPIKVPVVTLLVTPEQSERLALASLHGELQLTMRSAIDPGRVETPGVSPPELFEEEEQEKPVPPLHHHIARAVAAVAAVPKEDEVVEIIRGSRSEERKLHSHGGGQ